MNPTFDSILQAWKVQDPTLIQRLVLLASTPEPTPDIAIRDEELTFERFLQQIFSSEFRSKHPDVQFAERVAMIAQLEQEQGTLPLPDRFKIHLLLRTLWDDKSPFARAILMQAIDKLPLTYGVWKGLKAIFKEAEQQQDYEIFCKIACRIDIDSGDALNPISLATKTYMKLRAWRVLRNVGEQAPLLYPYLACQMLAQYPAEMEINNPMRHNSWVLNHICFHHAGYGKHHFGFLSKRKLFDAKNRAFESTWQRDYQPVLDLLLTAKNELVRQFATDCLKHDFKLAFRDVSVTTLQHLSTTGGRSKAVDECIVWLITQSPQFEQAKFKTLGLHDVVLDLLFSNEPEAFKYAIAYAQNYAQDLALAQLLLLAESQHEAVRDFAITQILARNPRTEIGVDAWGTLLDSEYHRQVAREQLLQHFNAKDLSPEWFFARLTSDSFPSRDFACTHIKQFYDIKGLGIQYFIDALDYLEGAYYTTLAVRFILDCFEEIGLNAVPAETWKACLLNPNAQGRVIWLLDNGELSHKVISMDFWHAVVYEQDWNNSEWVKQFTDPSIERKTKWQQQLKFSDLYALTNQVKEWMSDVRLFAPASLGFDWLMKLANSSQGQYRNFAIERINKGFIPADFAPTEQAQTNDSQATNNTETTVDLAGQSFLFTGKMQSMTRDEAETLVKNANGKINGSVNAKLDFLVIGDDGSPLYGNGRKGSKQVKAESLIAGGASLKIISETAFLQMLAGQSREANNDQTLAGAEVLWSMAIDDPTAFVSELATHYLARHHEQLCMALTDRPVDPDAIIPHEFFSSERIVPLFQVGHARLRELAIQLAEYELANWQMTPQQWLVIAESPHEDVQQLLKKSLLEPQTAENRRYHQGAEKLSAEILYSLVGSQKRFSRQLGMRLLQQYPQFSDPETLYGLTESTDREVRYSAVKMLWQHYRKRNISEHWQPSLRTENAKSNTPNTVEIGDHTAHFSQDLATHGEQLLLWLKRGLFELPPARLPMVKNSNNPQADKATFYNGKVQHTPKTIQQISASRAKLALIETFRDVALQDDEFARIVLPVLKQFTHSSGKMERNACLVAVTQIEQRYPTL